MLASFIGHRGGEQCPTFRAAWRGWDVTGLPVPTEALIYTKEEWNNLRREGRFASVLQREAVWLLLRE
jgi:hypothetical protein